MDYDLSEETQIYLFKEQCNWLLQNKALCKLNKIKLVRTNRQNAARWKYLEMCAQVLNDRGETFTPIGLKLEVPYTKDNLYHNYWNTLREFMYPNKKDQLNTKEFSELVEMVLMLFAKQFSISLPFPNWKDHTLKEV